MSDTRDVATDLDEVIDRLFDLAPGEFVAARDAAARQTRADGDREGGDEIAALRRPTVVAWLTNQLARQRADEIAQFLDLGAALREATATLSGPQLRELSRQRQALVSAMVREARTIARELSGSKVTEDMARALEETLLAALADPDAAEQVRAGRLSGGLTHRGFGAASAPSAPARGASPAPSRSKPSATKRPAAEKPDRSEQQAEATRRREAQRAELERAVGEAWAEARRTAEVREKATDAALRARDARRVAERRVRELEAEMATARTALEEADDAERSARDTRDSTENDAERARKAVTDLQGQLDAL
jgi:hypothetical protein